MSYAPDRGPRRVDPATQAAFDEVCQRLQGFEPALHFELVDGFLALLACAWQLPEPSDWLPALADEHFERAFADPEAHAAALKPLQARLRALRDELSPERLYEDETLLWLEPWLAEFDPAAVPGAEPRVDAAAPAEPSPLSPGLGTGWAQGVLLGFEHYAPRWLQELKLPADELQGLRELIGPVDALTWDAADARWPAWLAERFDRAQPTRDDLIADACFALQGLRLFLVESAPKPEQRRADPAAPGRNDPCPCGSGRKYKKCHGAAA